MSENKPPDRVIHPRLPHPLHEQLTEFAQRTHRTLNGAVVYLLEKALANEVEPKK